MKTAILQGILSDLTEAAKSKKRQMDAESTGHSGTLRNLGK